MPPSRFSMSRESAVFVGALLLLLFVSPVADWWAGLKMHWSTPYGLWLLVIAGAFLINGRKDPDEP